MIAISSGPLNNIQHFEVNDLRNLLVFFLNFLNNQIKDLEISNGS